MELLVDEADYTAVRFSNKAGKQWLLLLANENAAKEAMHQLVIKGVSYKWTGPFEIIRNDSN